MPKNVMKLLKRSVSTNLNDFDMSHRHLMGVNFGELRPLTFLETVPGDYFELRVSDLLRAIPMVTSPFLRAKQHIEVWYTPYHDLWSGFESFITKKDNPAHSSTLNPLPTYCPHIDIDVLKYVMGNFVTLNDIVGRNILPGYRDLCDAFGFGPLGTSISAPSQAGPLVNLFRVLQYNKVWYDEYRQKYYDSGLRFLLPSDFANGVVNPAVIFNVDDLLCNSVTNADIAQTSTILANSGTSRNKRIAEMFQMRYRCWKKDLFTGVLPSTQFGNVSTVDLIIDEQVYAQKGTLTYPVYIAGSNPPTGITSGSSYQPNSGNPNQGNYYSGNQPLFANGSTDFDVLALRKSEAIQMWRQNALTAGNRISDNMKSHYGDDAEYNDHRSTFLGAVSAPLNIMDINATAQTNTATSGGSLANTGLGDVAGKGLSSLDDKVFKFKAHEFGSIMVLFSLLPEAEYESLGIDRMNQLLEPEDFFTKEYQDLGLEAVGYENFTSAPAVRGNILGYAPRYFGYKQKLDKCFNGFHSGDDFEAWASPKTDVVNRLNYSAGSLPLALLYVNPKLYDVNFAAALDSATDYQFIGDFYFDCSAKRNMSLSGLPSF